MSAMKSWMEDIYWDFIEGRSEEEIYNRNSCTTEDLECAIQNLEETTE